MTTLAPERPAESPEDGSAVPWGIRSRYYDSSPSAALFYEAETLTVLNGAAVTGLSGASGGEAVEITGLAAASWAPMLATTISSGSQALTHQGSYRVWARCYSSTGTPEFQLLWGVGSLSVPVTNDATQLPGSGAFYLLDLGEVRLDYPPVGTAEWFGVVQAYSPNGGDSASVDCLYLQPLDDGAGVLTYVDEPSPAALSSVKSAGTSADSGAGGGVTWSNATSPASGGYASATGTVDAYKYTDILEETNFGFSIPSGATILGIVASVPRYASGEAQDAHVYLVKAGTYQNGVGQVKANAGYWPSSSQAAIYGSAGDLWGNTWAYSDINNSGFGVGIEVELPYQSVAAVAYVGPISVTVYYSLSSGFAVSQDAVIYADQTCEIRHDQMVREGPSGTVYGPVSNVVGDLARIPASGLEGRPCQIFVKPSRGDLNTLPDSGLDGFDVQVIYRPSFIFRP
jgi:hypothetical protein